MAEKSTNSEKEPSLALDAIIDEAKRIEENCLHTSKSHFNTAHVWTHFHLAIGIPTAILAAVAGRLAFASSDTAILWAGTISLLVCILSATATFLNSKERHDIHQTAGNNYNALSTSARIFWTIECRTESSTDVLTARIKEFSRRKEQLNRECPQPPKWAYDKARKGIDSGEAGYKVDKEKAEE